MISYKKAFELFREKKLSTYRMIKEKVITPASLQRMRVGTSPTNRGIDSATIDSLCKYLDCQPGDLMEYVEE